MPHALTQTETLDAAPPREKRSIRPATPDDIDELLRLEDACFTTDRITRRSFRHLLTRANATTLVDVEPEGRIAGYALVLFHRGAVLCRLYSIAVDPARRGHGIGRNLLEAVAAAAVTHGAAYMRLETRRDNKTAQRMFEASGFRAFGTYSDYYEDHMDAVRYERPLLPHPPPELTAVPYYDQTLDFTCGPASLMMAMRALDPAIILDRTLELRLWRESTTIFMTSGLGGCGPYGMALAAHRRGFAVGLRVSERGALFLDTVRSAEKKEVMALVQADFRADVAATDIDLRYGPVTVADLRTAHEAGAVPVVLINSYRLYRERFPHWVVITGFSDRMAFIHDPFVDPDLNRQPFDCINVPVLIEEFERMIHYGKTRQQAAILVTRREGP